MPRPALRPAVLRSRRPARCGTRLAWWGLPDGSLLDASSPRKLGRRRPPIASVWISGFQELEETLRHFGNALRDGGSKWLAWETGSRRPSNTAGPPGLRGPEDSKAPWRLRPVAFPRGARASSRGQPARETKSGRRGRATTPRAASRAGVRNRRAGSRERAEQRADRSVCDVERIGRDQPLVAPDVRRARARAAPAARGCTTRTSPFVSSISKAPRPIERRAAARARSRSTASGGGPRRARSSGSRLQIVLLHPLERLDVARGVGVAGPVGEFLLADLADHAREHLRVEQRLHHRRVAAPQDAHLADPAARRRARRRDRTTLVVRGVEPGREPRRDDALRPRGAPRRRAAGAAAGARPAHAGRRPAAIEQDQAGGRD